jgi:hypothetical protein
MHDTLRPPTKEIAIRDTDSGVRRLARLRAIARLDAEVSALVYRITGTVSRDVPAKFRQWAYDVRTGRVRMGRDLGKLYEILEARPDREEARWYAEQMIGFARQLMELTLPGPTDPPHEPTGARTASHCLRGTDRESSHARRGVGGVILGSFDGGWSESQDGVLWFRRSPDKAA